MFPFKDGVAAIVSLDGPEKNTVQYAPDGVNFKVASMIQVPRRLHRGPLFQMHLRIIAMVEESVGAFAT